MDQRRSGMNECSDRRERVGDRGRGIKGGREEGREREYYSVYQFVTVVSKTRANNWNQITVRMGDNCSCTY